ncbi:hypothetical protein BCR39DRAFT_362763 [Naematelia encephala]|uniref:RBR-type E3 ubiquitin transferase n=1 Tax=Naematelia encephala TaxID=71784 RepID=A0A1Y2AMN2_9TREE|nr:hypothetical protein BCR39DRAFT_362763 [Naematelia encephala]
MEDEVEVQCRILQEEEITALESIYPSQIVIQPNLTGKPGHIVTLTVPVSLSSPITAQLSSISQHASSSSLLPSLELSHLPPIEIRLFLPPSYPLTTPPKPITSRAPVPTQDGGHSSYLSRKSLGKIQEKLREMWKEDKELVGEGAGVLWRWWEWVASGDFFSDLDLLKGDTLELSVPPLIAPSTFHTSLKTYNAQQLHSSFESTAFSCSICMENRKGKSCIQMPGCNCVFCAPCLASCWSLAIEEGTLENVSCPSVTCVKQRATRVPGPASQLSNAGETDPDLVESVVGKELRDRWQELKERRRAEIDPTFTVCPRPTCQAAVPPPPLPTAADLASQSANSNRAIRLSDLGRPTPPSPPKSAQPVIAEDRWARYRSCPKCQYSFCLYCSATWHGPHTLCAFPQTSLIVQEYLSYPEGSEQRRLMELRRGKANLERMVTKWREDEENKKWLESRTRACAGCGVRVEKSHGCNHMTCGRCNAHFCYRCGSSVSSLSKLSPYRILFLY